MRSEYVLEKPDIPCENNATGIVKINIPSKHHAKPSIYVPGCAKNKNESLDASIMHRLKSEKVLLIQPLRVNRICYQIGSTAHVLMSVFKMQKIQDGT